MFTEGWVEFLDKRVAEAVAASLNNTPVGGNKRGFFSSDLWTLKYLKHFKWHHLTEKIAYEKRIAAQKLRSELSAAKKEAEHYVSQVEQARSIKEMEERKLKAKSKQAKAADDANADAEIGRGADEAAAIPSSKRKRVEAAPAPASGGAGASAADDVEAQRALIRRTFKQRAPLPDRTLDVAAAPGAAGGKAAKRAAAHPHDPPAVPVEALARMLKGKQ